MCLKRIDTHIRYKLQAYMQRKYPPYDGGVFVFHEVVDDMSDALDAEFAITTEHFTGFVNALKKKKILFGNPDDNDIDSSKVYFTFDDGYSELLNTAFPILEKEQIKYIVFLPTEFIGKPGYVDENELIKLDNDKYAIIGGHSKTHTKLIYKCKEELRSEIVDSKHILEEKLGHNIALFAYPYGSLDAVGRKAIKIAKSVGFRYAFSTLKVDADRLKKRWFYPRITVTSQNYKDILESISNRGIVDNEQ